MIIPISLCLPPATYESLYVGNPALVSPGWLHNSQFTIGWLHDSQFTIRWFHDSQSNFLTPSDRHQIVCFCLRLWFGKCVLSEHFLIGGNLSIALYVHVQLQIVNLHNHVLCCMTRLRGDNHHLGIYTSNLLCARTRLPSVPLLFVHCEP